MSLSEHEAANIRSAIEALEARLEEITPAPSNPIAQLSSLRPGRVPPVPQGGGDEYYFVPPPPPQAGNEYDCELDEPGEMWQRVKDPEFLSPPKLPEMPTGFVQPAEPMYSIEGQPDPPFDPSTSHLPVSDDTWRDIIFRPGMAGAMMYVLSEVINAAVAGKYDSLERLVADLTRWDAMTIAERVALTELFAWVEEELGMGEVSMIPPPLVSNMAAAYAGFNAGSA